MSAATATARNATDSAQATTRAGRKDWLASLQDEAKSFVKGDNNSPWAIFAETVIGCVPVLGQLVDARDIIKGLVEVSGAPNSPLGWFNLITALIGLVPGGGDAVKRSLRAVKGGTVHIDELLDMIRKIYKGDPEKLLKEVLDVSKLRTTLNKILDNPSLIRRLGPEVRKSIDTIQANLNKQFAAFKKEVDDWLEKGRKTSADGLPSAKRQPGAPPAKPQTQVKGGTQSKAPHSNSANPNTANPARQRTERFGRLSQKILGVLGEHMADYHCQDVKGWGSKVAHDTGGINPAKLNDRGQLVQLWPTIARGRGLDAVWKSNGPKPYAIIEAKASYNPAKSLKALLGEAGDKTERESGETAPYGKKGGRFGGKGRASEKGTIRQTNGKVTQMSHGWILKRLQATKLTDPLAKTTLLRDRKKSYSRHVLFFSIPHAVAHAEALIMLTAGQRVEHSFHATHQITREWGDSDIEKVVDNRAGFTDGARDARRR